MNDCFQGNLSLVTRHRYAMARQASAATREDAFELAVKRHPGSIRIRIKKNKITIGEK
jgi:hypothetical protein